MIEYSTRKLNDKDIKYLRERLNLKSREMSDQYMKLRKMNPIYSGVFLMYAILLLYFLLKKPINYLSIVLTGMIFAMSGYFLFSLIRRTGKSRSDYMKLKESIDNIFEIDTVNVLHCVSDKMVELQGVEGKKTEYLYQVEGNKILHISEEKSLGTDKFPSGDFELMTLLGADGSSEESYIKNKGERLTPLRVITSSEDEGEIEKIRQMPEVFEGSVEELDFL